MATIYYEKDIDAGVLAGKTVAVAGGGETAEALASNLRDSGVAVVDAAAEAGIVILAAPEQKQAKIYENEILPHLTENKALVFASGFAVHYGQIEPPDNVDAVLVAPQGPGAAVRAEFTKGAGVPALVAVCRDFSGNALKLALACASAAGFARAGIAESTFREATEAALFAEQAVVRGGVPELLRAAFDALTENGCSSETAYFATLGSLKLALGAGLDAAVSDTAEYGGHTRGGRVVGEPSREAMREILAEIQNGAFAREWLCEALVGTPVLRKMRERAAGHGLETTGRKLRKAAPATESANFGEA